MPEGGGGVGPLVGGAGVGALVGGGRVVIGGCGVPPPVH